MALYPARRYQKELSEIKARALYRKLNLPHRADDHQMAELVVYLWT